VAARDRWGVFSDLSWDEIEELRQNIATTLDYDPPGFETVVAAVEKTSRSCCQTPAVDSRPEGAYISALLTFLALMLQIYQT